LPLQNTTLFPETVVPLSVGRDRSVKAVERLATEEKLIAAITAKGDGINGDNAKPKTL
jgi:ATP-dependent Lon protease